MVPGTGFEPAREPSLNRLPRQLGYPGLLPPVV